MGKRHSSNQGMYGYDYLSRTEYLEDKTVIRDEIKQATNRFLAAGGLICQIFKKTDQQLIEELSRGPALTNRYMFGKNIRDIPRY